MINREDYLVLSAILTRRAVAKLRQAEKCVQKGNHPALIEKIRQDASWSERMAVELNAIGNSQPLAVSEWCPHCSRTGHHSINCPLMLAIERHNAEVVVVGGLRSGPYCHPASRNVPAGPLEDFNDDLPF